MTEDDLLKKWLNNELTDAEKEVFSKREDFAFNQEIVDKAKCFKASQFSNIDDFDAFKVKYKARPYVKRLNWLKPALRIASVLVIGFAIYFTMFMSQSVVEERTLLAEKTTIELPDLSSVVMNSDSEVSYDKASWFNKRQLNLKGEAYFRVAKGKTFDVITEKGVITVVGTEFNVKARTNYFEVKCYEGIVRVSTDTITRQLLAGDSFSILNNVFREGDFEATQPDWLKNKSHFKAIPLKEVINELERQFNVKVTFKDTDTSQLFSGGFTHNDLEKALYAITKPMNLTYKISSSNQVVIHGKTD
ncbi:FecR family protein [Winogradskyella sp.]|jgi:ferric-dicitrate binding protein FerR (iron transport regulator)|uniref:FecR family protein n=1 Tax=Winogradskyella sp. TaxID=1883156 RepID=UPI0025F084BE|nr:FecR domain-containing protein [Winogradskyella sp.]MCT4629723.1 FecR family protein [Winogradskyella sp.]